MHTPLLKPPMPDLPIDHPPHPSHMSHPPTIPTAVAVQTAPITLALVDRVSQRLAMGMPLKIALAGEDVKRADYKQYLRDHPELEERRDLAIQKFLDNAFNVMLDGENAAANFRWLIELVYPGVLGSEEVESARPKQTVLGLPEEILERIRQDARNAK